MEKIRFSCPYSKRDIDLATAFFQEGYKRAFNIVPGPVPWYVTALTERGELLSVLGLQLGKAGDHPLHRLYTIPTSEFPADYRVDASAYYSRFVSHKKGISPFLFYIATRYAIEQECTYGTAVFLGYMQRHFSSINCGDVWLPIRNAVFNQDSVPTDHLSYFLRPELTCYLADLNKKAERLKPFVREIVSRYYIVSDASIDCYLATLDPSERL